MQELYARTALVDRGLLNQLQQECNVIEAEECFRIDFWEGVRPLVRQWRSTRGNPADPLQASRESG